MPEPKRGRNPKTPIKLRPPIRQAMDSRPPITAAVAAVTHNTFRPDIYRVSEGYLN